MTQKRTKNQKVWKVEVQPCPLFGFSPIRLVDVERSLKQILSDRCLQFCNELKILV